MKKNKVCGSCSHFTDEDSNGNGYCNQRKKIMFCGIDFGCNIYQNKVIVGNDLKGIKDLFKKAGINI